MAWMDSNSDEIWNGGTFRLTFSYPIEQLVPDVSVPKSVTIPLVNTRLTLTSWQIDKANSKVIAVITSEATDKLGAIVLSNQAEDTAMTHGDFKNPYLPLVRTDGGYSKLSATANVYQTKAPAQTAVVPVLAIAAVIAALVGGALIYLTLDKVEKLTESPSVNLFIIAISLAILFGIFIYYKKGLA